MYDYNERLDVDTWQLQHELLCQPTWSESDESYIAVTETMTFYAPTADEAFWQWADWYAAEKKLRTQIETLPC